MASRGPSAKSRDPEGFCMLFTPAYGIESKAVASRFERGFKLASLVMRLKMRLKAAS